LEQEIKQYFGISLGPQQQASSTIIRSAYTSEEEVVQPIFFSKNAALFVQDQYRLGENYTFTGGLRFDMDDEYGQVLNPRLTLVRSPQVGFGFKMLYGRAFKAPTVFELFDEFRGNERLNPEKIATGEIEFNYRIGRAALLKASFYYSKLTDIILVAPNPDPSRVPIGPNSEYLDYYQNIGSTSIRGFTLSADYQLNRSLSYYGNYAFTAGKDSDPLDNTARHKVNLGLDYSWAQKADLSLRANWRGQVKAPISNRYFQAKTAATIAEVGYDYMTESSPDGYMDGELLMHLTLSLYPLSDRLPLTPQFIVKNALNTQYAGIGRQSGSGVRPIDQPQIQNPSGFIPPYHPQPGREIFFVLRYDFSQR
jgi:outer membrane receptor for ferrienterochelin and colicins